MTRRSEHPAGNKRDITASSVTPLFRTQADFVAAICRGETRALREMFLAYAPLLRDQAQKLSTPRDLRDELVTTVLDDVALHLQGAVDPPHELGVYLVAALRNRARSRHRDNTRRASRTGAAADAPGSKERIITECHSEYGVRAANPREQDDTVLRTSIAKLAERTVQMLNETDLHLVVGMARRIPVREIAEQVGISYGTARVRIHRLRGRMVKIMRQHVATLADEERHEVERFFRRAGIDVRSTAISPRETSP